MRVLTSEVDPKQISRRLLGLYGCFAWAVAPFGFFSSYTALSVSSHVLASLRVLTSREG
jgi:hypothetical protein